jgi:hypothetical protein
MPLFAAASAVREIKPWLPDSALPWCGRDLTCSIRNGFNNRRRGHTFVIFNWYATALAAVAPHPEFLHSQEQEVSMKSQQQCSQQR